MKNFNKNSVVGIATVSFILGLTGLNIALAATTPNLGAATTYGILSSTYTNTVSGTTVNGDVGFTTGPVVAPTGSYATYGSGALYSTAGTDQGNTLNNLNSQVCTFNFANGAIDLAADTTHGPIGIYTPGVYCTTGAASIGTAGITLNGAGTYIFRINGALTSVANSHVTLAGASACDVFWTPTQATTLGANSSFVGSDIDASGITLGNNVSWAGRALAFGGTVTTEADNISVPSCAITPPVSTAVAPLIRVTKIPTPSVLPYGPGAVVYDYAVSNVGTVAMSNISVTDNKCANVGFISGDTNGDSKLDVNEIWNYRCSSILSQTTTNTVTVAGQANGFTSTATANATVVVNVPTTVTPTTVTPVVVSPTFPNTGLAPEEKNISSSMAILAGIFTVATLVFISRRKQII